MKPEGLDVPRAYRRTCSTESRAGSTEMKIGFTKRKGDDSGNDFSDGQVSYVTEPPASDHAPTVSTTFPILSSSSGHMSGQFVNPKYTREYVPVQSRYYNMR